MPKVQKKIRANALTQKIRHEPLGQVLEGDESRKKYAVPTRGRRKERQVRREENKEKEDEETEYVDDKTAQKILQMTREQRYELQLQDHIEQRRQTKERQLQRQPKQQQDPQDSDEEDEEEDQEDVLTDEGEE